MAPPSFTSLVHAHYILSKGTPLAGRRYIFEQNGRKDTLRFAYSDFEMQTMIIIAEDGGGETFFPFK